MSADILQVLLVLFSFVFCRCSSLLCNQCGGERYAGDLRLLRSICCAATTIECAAGLVCLRAVVVSPKKSFILSGCHVPEDGLIGCDVHSLPHNATIHRCICLDQSCQAHFPNGDCSRIRDTPSSVTEQLRSHTLTVPHNIISSSTRDPSTSTVPSISAVHQRCWLASVILALFSSMLLL